MTLFTLPILSSSDTEAHVDTSSHLPSANRRKYPQPSAPIRAWLDQSVSPSVRTMVGLPSPPLDAVPSPPDWRAEVLSSDAHSPSSSSRKSRHSDFTSGLDVKAWLDSLPSPPQLSFHRSMGTDGVEQGAVNHRQVRSGSISSIDSLHSLVGAPDVAPVQSGVPTALRAHDQAPPTMSQFERLMEKIKETQRLIVSAPSRDSNSHGGSEDGTLDREVEPVSLLESDTQTGKEEKHHPSSWLDLLSSVRLGTHISPTALGTGVDAGVGSGFVDVGPLDVSLVSDVHIDDDATSDLYPVVMNRAVGSSLEPAVSVALGGDAGHAQGSDSEETSNGLRDMHVALARLRLSLAERNRVVGRRSETTGVSGTGRGIVVSTARPVSLAGASEFVRKVDALWSKEKEAEAE